MSESAGFGGTVRTIVATTMTPYSNVWAYDRNRLILVYSVAIAIVIICDAVGFACVVNNDRPSSKAFSRIVAVTRAPGLARLAEFDRREAGLAKLRYGLVEGEGGRRRFGFELVEVGANDDLQ